MLRWHWPLINLALLFLIPVLSASALLKFYDQKQLPLVNYGTLINPTQTLDLSNIDVSPIKWKLIHITDKDDANFAAKLEMLHTALGAQRDRVQLLTTNATSIGNNIANQNIIIVDPRNLYVMQYNDAEDLNHVLKDLQRLLKYSHAK